MTPALSGCLLTFTLDNGKGWTATYSATTGANGVGSTTQTLASGTYSVKVAVGGNCTGTPDTTGALVIATPGDSAYGGGWYTLTGRTNFGFEVSAVPKTSPVQYKGQLVWGYKGAWRFKGTLSSYTKTTATSPTTGLATATGVVSGTGSLYWWNSALNGGLGDWALASSSVTVTITLRVRRDRPG